MRWRSHRVDSVAFDVAIFTNLTRDHLDFHLTMENYFAAKRRLFIEGRSAHAVINVDDAYGARLAREPELDGKVVTFALEDDNRDIPRDGRQNRAGWLELHRSGRRTASTGSPHPCVADSTCTTSSVRSLPRERSACLRALRPPQSNTSARSRDGSRASTRGSRSWCWSTTRTLPIRWRTCSRAARNLTDHQLHVVFGCGGDRDQGKRPLMGEIAARLADQVIVTSDNPRSEDPEAISAEILSGIDRDVAHTLDRRDAISDAIERAKPGDVVVIAGKGHEQGQEFEEGRKVPFDDVEVARDALRSLVSHDGR